jgi:hypothetical protein
VVACCVYSSVQDCVVSYPASVCCSHSHPAFLSECLNAYYCQYHYYYHHYSHLHFYSYCHCSYRHFSYFHDCYCCHYSPRCTAACTAPRPALGSISLSGVSSMPPLPARVRGQLQNFQIFYVNIFSFPMEFPVFFCCWIVYFYFELSGYAFSLSYSHSPYGVG